MQLNIIHNGIYIVYLCGAILPSICLPVTKRSFASYQKIFCQLTKDFMRANKWPSEYYQIIILEIILYYPKISATYVIIAIEFWFKLVQFHLRINIFHFIYTLYEIKDVSLPPKLRLQKEFMYIISIGLITRKNINDKL